MSGGIGDAMGGAVFSEGRRSSRWGRRSDDLSDAWQDTQDRGSRALSQIEHSAEDAYYATRRFVYHHPVQALLGVTAFAFAVGALWRLGSRDRRYGQDLFHRVSDRVSDYVDPRARSVRRSWF